MLMCQWCEEPLDPASDWAGSECLKERDPVVHRMHRECAIRSVIGSVGHLQRTCSCYGGQQEDPPEMTRRQAAKAAMELWILRRAGHGGA